MTKDVPNCHRCGREYDRWEACKLDDDGVSCYGMCPSCGGGGFNYYCSNCDSNYIELQNGVSISKELNICEKCLHSNHLHMTRDFTSFECLEKDCSCTTQ